MGDAADDILLSFGLSAEELKKYKTVKEKFDEYFIKKKNTIYERAQFNSRKQEEGEPVGTFITALHKLAAKCEYGHLHNEMIHDRIVVGIQNHTQAERMQLDETLDLAKATKMARENEAIKQQQPELRDKKIKQAVDDIQSKGQNKPKRSLLPISSRTQKSGPYR